MIRNTCVFIVAATKAVSLHSQSLPDDSALVQVEAPIPDQMLDQVEESQEDFDKYMAVDNFEVGPESQQQNLLNNYYNITDQDVSQSLIQSEDQEEKEEDGVEADTNQDIQGQSNEIRTALNETIPGSDQSVTLYVDDEDEKPAQDEALAQVLATGLTPLMNSTETETPASQPVGPQETNKTEENLQPIITPLGPQISSSTDKPESSSRQASKIIGLAFLIIAITVTVIIFADWLRTQYLERQEQIQVENHTSNLSRLNRRTCADSCICDYCWNRHEKNSQSTDLERGNINEEQRKKRINEDIKKLYLPGNQRQDDQDKLLEINEAPLVSPNENKLRNRSPVDINSKQKTTNADPEYFSSGGVRSNTEVTKATTSWRKRIRSEMEQPQPPSTKQEQIKSRIFKN